MILSSAVQIKLKRCKFAFARMDTGTDEAAWQCPAPDAE
jgi:hypothetical protein